MLFNSHVFIVCFLPVALWLYYCLSKNRGSKVAMGSLILLSLFFYGYNSFLNVFVLVFSVLFNYCISKLLISRVSRTKMSRVILICGVMLNVILLGYFKYMNFIVENYNILSGDRVEFSNVTLPLGISFYTFQQISFIVDVYNNKVDRITFVEYAAYITFFPQLIAGPIVRHSQLMPQFMDEERKTIDWENMYKGILLFALGLTKKVVFADTLGNGVNYSINYLSEINAELAWLTMIAYTFEIYFDFSGYCDMAMGLGKMFNVELPINFNAPYRAISVSEFWNRWHMTLTSFLTEYVYIPLGGSHGKKYRTYMNVMIVFLISGLWHGASWMFIIWGALHGAATVLERIIGEERLRKIPIIFRWVITFGFVNFAWLIFRLENFESLKLFLRAFGKYDRSRIVDEIIERGFCPIYVQQLYYHLFGTPRMFVAVGLIVSFFVALIKLNTCELVDKLYNKKMGSLMCVCLLVWCVLNLNSGAVFLYFNF